MHKLSLAALPLLASSLLAQGTLEAVEPNNTTTTATVLPGGAQGYGDIVAGDEDWFKITLAADQDYKIWTSPGFTGQIGNTQVRILAADGTTQIIDVDDGDVATHGFYTTFQGTLLAGDYYVAVRGFDQNTVGSYTLDVVLADLGTYVGASLPVGVSTVTINLGGCAGTAGTPHLTTRESSTHVGVRPELPVLGSTFYLDGVNLPASGLVLRVIGLDKLATPFDLTSLGAPGCQVEVDPLDQTFGIADASGVDFWGIGSPANTAFIGLTLEQQLAVLDLPANALGMTVSNMVSSVFGVTH